MPRSNAHLSVATQAARKSAAYRVLLDARAALAREKSGPESAADSSRRQRSTAHTVDCHVGDREPQSVDEESLTHPASVRSNIVSEGLPHSSFRDAGRQQPVAWCCHPPPHHTAEAGSCDPDKDNSHEPRTKRQRRPHLLEVSSNHASHRFVSSVANGAPGSQTTADSCYRDADLAAMDSERLFVIPSPEHLRQLQHDATIAMQCTADGLVACSVCELDFEATEISSLPLTDHLVEVSCPSSIATNHSTSVELKVLIVKFVSCHWSN
jgi:hypothetical protein